MWVKASSADEGASTAPAGAAAPGFLAPAGRVLFVVALPLSLVWLPIGRVPGAGTIAASDAALVALWAATGVALLVRGKADLDLRTPLMILLAAAIAVLAGIGSELSAREGRGFFEFMQFMKRFGLASILPLAAGLFRSPAVGAWIRALALAAIAALVAFTALPDLQQVLPMPEYLDPDTFALEERATGMVMNPNDLAYAAVGLALLHAALLPRRPGIVDRALLGVALAGSAFCLISSGSRSGVIGAAGALIYILLSSGIRFPAKLALAATVAIAVSLGLSHSTVFEERLTRAYQHGLGEENVSARLDAQWLAIRSSLSHPFGVGYAGYDVATSHARTYDTLVTTDSVYFDTLLGAGFLGLFCLLWLFWTAWRHVGRPAAGYEKRAHLLKAGLVAFLLFGTATVVPVSVFLSPLFFSLVGVASYARDEAS